jgi:tRNA/rRNA methyltransferase/putative endonuclease
MPFWTYMLYCCDRSFYVGHTDHLEQRVEAHREGSASDYTARRRPVKMVWSQEFGSRTESLEAERQLKGWTRAKKLALIRSDWALISILAQNKHKK